MKEFVFSVVAAVWLVLAFDAPHWAGAMFGVMVLYFLDQGRVR